MQIQHHGFAHLPAAAFEDVYCQAARGCFKTQAQ
jgi:hypothetical protein